MTKKEITLPVGITEILTTKVVEIKSLQTKVNLINNDINNLMSGWALANNIDLTKVGINISEDLKTVTISEELVTEDITETPQEEIQKLHKTAKRRKLS